MKIIAVQPRKMGLGAFSRVDQEGRLDEEGDDDMVVMLMMMLMVTGREGEAGTKSEEVAACLCLALAR